MTHIVEQNRPLLSVTPPHIRRLSYRENDYPKRFSLARVITYLQRNKDT